MKIFKSRSNFELSAVLTDLECVLYREACRTKTPVSIPELDDERFIVKGINPCDEKDAPKNSWDLVIKPAAVEGMRNKLAEIERIPRRR